MKLEHFAINVPEPAAIAQWFVDALGMRIVTAQKESPYIHFIADEHGSMIELYNNPNAPMPDYSQIDPFNFHIAFWSTNIEEDAKKLIAAGATQIGGFTSSMPGTTLAFFRNPWQIPVQLVQRPKALV
jgi:glyoxylase I family protein